MTTIGYGGLTRQRLLAQPSSSSALGSPGVRGYVDSLAALVSAEVLGLHTIVVGLTTTTIRQPDGRDRRARARSPGSASNLIGPVLACRVVESDRWCRRCGCEGTSRDSVARRLAHEPLGWRPRRCRSPCAATGAPAAGTCGTKTPPEPRRRGRSSPAAGCGGRWKGSCAST